MQSNDSSDTSDIYTRRQRRWHAKVTSGCMTCRRRRVKCDEIRPICGGCSRLNFTCRGHGYGDDASTTDISMVSSDFQVVTPDSFAAKQRKKSYTRQASISTTDSFDLSSTDSQLSQSPASVILPSISTILSANRYDPFASACVSEQSPADRRLLDHAVYCQWNIFATTEKQRDIDSVRSEIMSHALTNQAAFYTIIYAAASHHAFWSNEATNNPPQDLCRLALKARAIRAMIEALKDGDTDITDSIIISLVILSAQGSGEYVRREKLDTVYSRKTLVRAMDTEYYGALDPGVEHLRMLYLLIQRRGGIHKIRSRAAQISAIMFDVWNSWKCLCPPGIPKLLQLTDLLKMRTWSTDPKGAQLYDCLTKGLTPILEATAISTRDTLLDIVECLRVLTTDLNQIRRTPKPESVLSAPHQPTLVWLRSMTMHTVLGLPDYTSRILASEGDPSMDYLIHNLCRLACLMYAQIWLHPMVNRRVNMARKLLLRMRPLLEISTSCLYNGSTLCNLHPEFFLWVLVFTIICAYEDFDVTGSMESLQDVSPLILATSIKPSPESWATVSDTLESFLWARSDCELTGREAWQWACSLVSSSPENQQRSSNSPIELGESLICKSPHAVP